MFCLRWASPFPPDASVILYMRCLLTQDPAQPLHSISTPTVIYTNVVFQVSRLKPTFHLLSTSKSNKSRRKHDILDTSNLQLGQCHPGDLLHSADICCSFPCILQHKGLPQISRWCLENSTQTCLFLLCLPWWLPVQHYQNACHGASCRSYSRL